MHFFYILKLFVQLVAYLHVIPHFMLIHPSVIYCTLMVYCMYILSNCAKVIRENVRHSCEDRNI